MTEHISKAKRKRSYKHLLMLVLSLALGAVGVFYSRHYINDQIAYYKSQLDKTEPMTQVVVPKRSMVRGEVLKAADLSVRDIPEKYADSNSVNSANYDTAIGQRVDFDIDKGRPLLWAHLEGGLTPTFSGKVPEGLRAMTIRVDEINSISGFLQPKDRIDLLLVYGNGSKQRIFPLIQNLDVIATGVQTMVDKNGLSSKRSFSSITVQVTPDQAQKLTLSQRIGKLTAVLRNPDDESALSDKPMTVAMLLNELMPATKKSPPRKRNPSVAKAPELPGIEYIIGGVR